MAKLSTEDVLKLAQLARLRLSEQEVERYAKELEAILKYVEQLDKLDLGKYEPTSQVSGLKNVMRDDEVSTLQPSDELLKNVPSRYKNYIKVKRMLG